MNTTNTPALGNGLNRVVRQLGDGTAPTVPAPVVITVGDLVKMTSDQLKGIIAKGNSDEATGPDMRLALNASAVLSKLEAAAAASSKGKGGPKAPGRYAPLPEGVAFQWYREEARASKEAEGDRFAVKFRPEHDALQLSKGAGAKSCITVRVSPSGHLHLDGCGGGFAGVTIDPSNLRVLAENGKLLAEFCQRNASEMATQRLLADGAAKAKDAEKAASRKK